MISVCIPVYNYDVGNLVYLIQEQLVTADVPFEILILDDASTDLNIKITNRKLLQLPCVCYDELVVNIGNRDIRHALIKKAIYDWVLFLDADTIPAKDNFIQQYIDLTSKNIDGICGGITYGILKNSQHIFRWKYGKEKEEFSKNIEPCISEWKGANTFIKKSVYQSYHPINIPQKYGYEDALWAIQLDKMGFNLIFIDNPVIHCGLEQASVFLNKFHQSIENALYLANNYPSYAQEISLIRFFYRVKKWKMIKIFSMFFKPIKPLIVRNLLGENPNITLFQLYKIGYLCELAVSKTLHKISS